MSELFDRLLHDREQRAQYQKKLTVLHDKTLIVIKANYPGYDKQNYNTNFVVTKAFFDLKQLISLIEYKVKLTSEGLIYYLIVEDNLKDAKRHAITIEDSKIGRLVDIDVFFRSASCSRRDLDIAPRTCFICDMPAHVCVRSAKHTYESITSYFDECVTECILANPLENLCIFGLINELCKPYGFGCVGIHDTGSHDDMDATTFIDSIEAVKSKIKHIKEIDSTCFTSLREFGLSVEHAMFKATKGINTHKGFIFILTLVYAGLVSSESYEDIPDQISLLSKDLFLDFETSNTHGSRIYHQYKIAGVRGAAYNGFSDYFTTLVPLFMSNTDITRIYLIIISQIEDTNILHRSDYESYLDIKNKALAISNEPTHWPSFNQECISKNISCGGSSDVLACSLILYKICTHYATIKSNI